MEFAPVSSAVARAERFFGIPESRTLPENKFGGSALSAIRKETEGKDQKLNPPVSVAPTAETLHLRAEPKPALALRLSQTEWKLDFETFSSDYVLKTALTLELLDKAADKLHLRATCQQEYPKKMELDDWERNDHLAIAQAAEEIARGCHAQFATALNLAATTAAANPSAASPEPAAQPDTPLVAAPESAVPSSETTPAPPR